MRREKILLGSIWVLALVVVAWLYQQNRTPEGERPLLTASDAPTFQAGVDVARDVPLPEDVEAELGQLTSYRAGRRHTGRSPFRGPRAVEVTWTAELGGRISAQPVVDSEGTIYLGTHAGALVAIAANGEERWRRSVLGPVWSAAVVNREGQIFVGSDAGVVFAFDADGNERWRFRTSGDADTGITLSRDGRLHFASNSSLYALRASGEAAWHFEARGTLFSTPAIDSDGTLYVGGQDDYIYALAPSGRMRWEYRTGDDNDSSPVIGDDGTVFVGSDDNHVYALNRDGSLRWRAHVGGHVRGPMGLTHDGGLLVGVFGPQPRVVRLSVQQGDLEWFFPVSVSTSDEVGIVSGPVVDPDGNIFFGAYDHFVYSLTPRGELRWTFETRGRVDASVLIAEDGVVLVGTDAGTLYALGERTSDEAAAE